MLCLDSFHLVVHDIGGPVGFAMAADMPERIKSITILNTWVNVEDSNPCPCGLLRHRCWARLNWPDEPRHLELCFFFPWPLPMQPEFPEEEVEAYIDLLKRGDGGKAFLKIMRGFDHSPAFAKRCYRAVQNVPYPLQAIWGVQDPGLKYEKYGRKFRL